jgi:hypothetical protein
MFNEALMRLEDIVSLCALTGAVLAMHVATITENLPCAPLPAPCMGLDGHVLAARKPYATIPKEALAQMRHLACLQNSIDTLFLAMSFSHILGLLPLRPRCVPSSVGRNVLTPNGC